MALTVYEYDKVYDSDTLHSEMMAAFPTTFDHLGGNGIDHVEVHIDDSVSYNTVKVVIDAHVGHNSLATLAITEFRAYADNNTVKLWAADLVALYQAIGDDDSSGEDDSDNRYDNAKAIIDVAHTDMEDKFMANFLAEEGLNLLGIITLSTKRAYIRTARRFCAFYIPALLSLKTTFNE